jgi:ABC-type glycerol-3-phosphate transport system substrate-binding protein
MIKMKWLVPFAAFALIVSACGDDDAAEKEVTIFGAFTSIEGDAVNAVIDDMIESDADYTAF